MPTAWLRTSTWLGPGWGVGSSSSFRTAGPPYSETRIAFMDGLLSAPESTSSGRGRVRSSHPERRGLADPLEIGAALRGPARIPRREIVAVQHVPAALGAEEAGQLRQADEALLGSRLELAPAPRMLFRPEEVHAGSEVVWSAARRPEPEGEMPDDPGRIHPGDAPVAHLHRDRIAAVEARRVHADGLAREEPRHRRGLEPALREPALLAAYRDPVLGGKVVQRRERGDVVGLGMEPADRVRLHDVAQHAPSLLGGQAEGPRQLRIVRRAAGVHQTSHDALEGLVDQSRTGHGSLPLTLPSPRRGEGDPAVRRRPRSR